MRWVLLAMLLGCAPGAKGPLLAPPVPAIRPGHGLPLFSPEPERPPRSPHKRVLPPTPEPGIWAVNPPQEDVPSILGTPLPVGVDEADPVTRTSRACEGLMAKALFAATQDLSAWSTQQKRCLGAILYFMCAHDDAGVYSRMIPARDKMTANRLRVLADALRERECIPRLPAAYAPVRDAIQDQYYRLDGRR